MDKKNETCREVSEDATRESLIAISYKLPETEQLMSEDSPEKFDEGRVEQGNGDEKYRSKLMSISNSESPEMKVVPVLPAQVDA